MAYNRIYWENGDVREEGYVTIDGVKHTIVQPEYEGNTPINADNLNHMDKGIKDNAVKVLTDTNSEGCIQIGNIGMEWGKVSVTSPSSASTTSPFNIYSGTVTVNFTQRYYHSPQVIVCWAGSYYNQIQVNCFNIYADKTSIGFSLTSPNSSRTIRYFVIGTVSEDDNDEEALG